MHIRVQSKSDRQRYYTLNVHGLGKVTCDCGAEGFCSHIDAALVHGIATVVHPDEQQDLARVRSLAGKIDIPPNWRASWLQDTAWINGVERRRRTASRSGETTGVRGAGRPGVCFSGTSPYGERKELVAEAEQSGWAFTSSITALTQVLVVADKASTTGKPQKARFQGVMIVDYDEWKGIRREPFWTRG